MTEIELKEDKFYVLTVKGKEKKLTLHSDMDSPITRVKKYLKSGKSPDDIELMVVEIKEENFEIKSIPWSTIAVRLVRE